MEEKQIDEKQRSNAPSYGYSDKSYDHHNEPREFIKASVIISLVLYNPMRAADGVGGKNELDDAARHLGWCTGRRDVVLVVS